MLSLLITLLSILALSNTFPFPTNDPKISTELLCLSTTEYDSRNNLKRLPTAVVPYHYDIDIGLSFPTKHIHLHPKPSRFNGTLHLYATVAEHTKNVTVHAWDLNIFEVHAYIRGREIAIERKQDYPCFRQYVVFFKEQLRPGTKLRILFNYTGAIVPFSGKGLFTDATPPLGLFYETYKYNGEDRYIFATQFEAFQARRLGPMMDEPALKATFQLTIGHPLQIEAKTNTPLLLDIAGRFSVFERTVRMSTYLLAIYVGELSAKSMMSSSNKTNISMLAWKGMDDYLEPALKAAVTVHDWFGNYFDLPFPLPKQDLANLPKFFGAMENWGLMIFRSDVNLIDRSLQTLDRQTYRILVHEIAHQWFGNLVTMKWWDELFLNEALTTFYSFRGRLVLYPKQPKWIEQQRMDRFRLGLNNDRYAKHPIVFGDGLSVGKLSTIYKKGSAMFSMIETLLGEEHFKKAITNYLKKHAYGNVDRNDLWHALTMVTKEMPDLKDWCGNQLDMKEFAEPWFLQQNFPVVNVRKTTDAAKPSFTLSQENINNDTSKFLPSEFGYKWSIPIWYRSDQDIGTKMKWLGSGRNNKCQSDVTIIQADWLAVNVNNRAFIRVHYDDASWDALLQQIKTDRKVFDAEYLAQLLDDLYYFGYTMEASANWLIPSSRFHQNSHLGSAKKRVYNLIEQLEGIESGSIMTNMNSRLQDVLRNDSPRAKKQYIEKFLSPLAKKNAWTFSDDYDIRNYQQKAWKVACTNDLFDCRKVAYETFASCMQEYDAHGKQPCASLPPQKWFLLKYGVQSPKVTKRQLASLRSAVAYVKGLTEQGGIGYALREFYGLIQYALYKANKVPT